jgi:hypothetical protein
MTSNADINGYEPPRMSAVVCGPSARRKIPPRRGWIELLKRVSQVRILPGDRQKGQLKMGFLPGWPFVTSGVVPHACH